MRLFGYRMMFVWNTDIGIRLRVGAGHARPAGLRWQTLTARSVGEGFIPPAPLSVIAYLPVHSVGAAYMPPAPPGQHPINHSTPVGAGHARPATLRRRPLLFCIVGRGQDPSAGRRGRRPLQRWLETTPTPMHARGGLRAGRPTISRSHNP